MAFVLADLGGGILQFSLLLCGGVLLILLAGGTWVWAVLDCLAREPRDSATRWFWFSIVLLLPVIGALTYFAVRRPRRIRELGI